MKKIILLSMLTLMSCKKEQNINQSSDSKKENNKNSASPNYLFENLSMNGKDEKINLLSITKNIPEDSLRLIIREYLYKTEGIKSINHKKDYDKILDTISINYHVPKLTIAEIVYLYKFEVENEIIETFEDNED